MSRFSHRGNIGGAKQKTDGGTTEEIIAMRSGNQERKVEKDLEMARRMAGTAVERGGRVYFVGGFVRDGVMGARKQRCGH